MSLLISGPKGPGNDIDVYLRPLIDELKILWESGVDTYDVSKSQNFQMKAAVMWTVNDFPAYANLSGWSTKENLTCPCYTKETSYRRLKTGSKLCYMGHRRFLLEDQLWWDQKMQFDRKINERATPKRQEGDEVLNELDGLRLITFGKAGKKQVIAGFGKKHNIFFELPY